MAIQHDAKCHALFVGYLGRPPSASELSYWSGQLAASSNGPFASGLVAHLQAQASFVADLAKSTEQLVADLFVRLTGSALTDMSIFNHFVNGVRSGLYDADSLPVAILRDCGIMPRSDGAGGLTYGAPDNAPAEKSAVALVTASGLGDALMGGIENKVTVSTEFTDALDTPAENAAYSSSTTAAETLLGTVTSNDATVTTATASVEQTVDDTISAGETAAGQTYTLTTAIDNFTGTSGNDTFNGSYIDANASGTTANPGDIMNGGAGTDVLNIAASGSAAPGTISALNLTGIEKVALSQYNTNAAGITVDLALADSALATVGLSSSGGQAATFSNLTHVVDAEMKSGNSNLTLSFNATANTGTTDAIDLAVAGAGNSSTTATFTAAGVETINVASSLVTSNIAVVGSGMSTLNISGDTAVSVDVSSATNANLKTIDASTATGKVTVVTGTTAPSGFTTVTGGLGTTDVFATDYIAANITNTLLSKVSGFETIKATGSGGTVSLTAALTGVTTLDASDTDAQTVTLGVGYTGDTTVKVGITNADTVSNSAANVNLTVTGVGAAFNTVNVTGGTGTDTLKITADDSATTSGAQTARSLTNATGIDAITIVADSSYPAYGTKLTNVKSTSSTVTVNVDASGLTNSSSIFNLTANAANSGKMSVTGGAGNDLVDLNSSTAANTVAGGSGIDSITAGAGNDSIAGGAGNDIIVMGANLTSADVIDGGDGTDTVKVSSLTNAAAFAGVTNVEVIAITGATSASLTSAIGTAATFDLTDTSVQTVTLSTGYTGDTTVKLGATGVDAVTNSANVTLTVSGNGQYFDTATITGGTGTDTLSITADDTSSSLTARSLANISNVDAVTISANTTDPTKGVALTTGASTWTSTTKTMSVDASALGSLTVFNWDGTATVGKQSVTGGAGNDIIKGGNAAETLSGGAGNDAITGSDTASINDSISGGDGNDTITMNSGLGTLDYNDTIDGGAGTDTLIIGTPASGILAHVTNVEVLQIAASGSFGAEAIGFNTFDLNNTTANAAETLTLAAGFTGDTTVKMGLVDADIVVNTANVALTMTGNVADFTGAITGGTGTDTLKMTADGIGVAIAGTSIDAVTFVANSTPTTGTGAITMAATTIATGKTMTVDGSALTNSSAVMNISGATTTTTGRMSVTGGAGNDIITGTGNADTIVGGSGDDSISSGAGLDVLTGGAGNDQFVVSSNANGLTFASITDAAAGDVVSFGSNITGQPSLAVPAQMTLAAGATTLSDYINAATAGDGNTNSILKWFQFGGNTYMVVDNTTAGTFTAATDYIVQLAGEIDLSSSAIAADASGADWILGTTTTSAPGTRPAAALAITGGADNLVGGAGADVVTVATLAQWAGAAAFDTIAGGLGADTITVTENAAVNVADAQFTKVTSVESLTFSGAGANAHSVVLGTIAQAAGITTVSLAGDAGTNDTLTLDANAYTVGLTVTAAAAGAITAYTAGTGADSVTGSSAVDTFIYGANLTSADTIAGGGNTDVLKVSGTVADAAFTNVTTTETLTFTATGSVVLSTLSAAAGIVTVTTGAFATTVDGSARTNALNITGGAAADVLKGGSAADTIATGGGGDTVTGGAGADGITLGAGVDSVVMTMATDTGATWATADVITSFVTADDGINVDTAVGTVANYGEADGAAMANEAAVLGAAQTALNGTVQYYYAFNVNGAGDGYLYYDADGVSGGEVVVKLVGGVNAAFFGEADIV